MKNTLVKLAFATSLLAAPLANGAVFAGTGIIDGAGGDTLIRNHASINGGAPLASGYAAAGYFSLTDVQVATLASAFVASSYLDMASLNSLIAAFTPLGIPDDFVTGANNFFGTAVPGGYVVGADLGKIGLASPELNKTLYTFFGGSATLAGSSQWGLVFHNGVAINRDDDVPTPDDNNIALNAPYTLLLGTVGATSYDGSAIFGPSAANAPAATIDLVTGIPEPSAALLGLAGALVFFRRRR